MNMGDICHTFKYVPVVQSNLKKIELLLCAWSRKETVFEYIKCKSLFEQKHLLWKNFLYKIPLKFPFLHNSAKNYFYM